MQNTIRARMLAAVLVLLLPVMPVSAANPWVRPPPELCSLSPMTSSDRVELRFRTRTGSWTYTTDLTAGAGHRYVGPGVTVAARSQIRAVGAAERGAERSHGTDRRTVDVERLRVLAMSRSAPVIVMITVLPADRVKSDAVQEAFYREIMQRNPSAIGYVEPALVTPSVRVIRIDP